MLLEGRARTLETLLQLFSTSQFFSDLLDRQSRISSTCFASRCAAVRAAASCCDQLQEEIDAASEDGVVLRTFRRFRQRQVLRIGTNDIIRDRPLEEITRDISRVADTALEVALTPACATSPAASASRSPNDGEPARCVILAFGKLGGKELNYSSDIDLMFLYDDEGTTTRHAASRTSATTIILPASSARWSACSARTPTAARPIASICGCGPRDSAARWPARWPARCPTTTRWAEPGNARPSSRCGRWPATFALGEEFLRGIEPFVYRKYLSVAEINEIKALKRRIEHKIRAGAAKANRGQDRPRRHPRRRVHHPVPATAQRRRSARRARSAARSRPCAALEHVGCLTDTGISRPG